MKPSIIIHGGAWNIPPELARAHTRGVGAAADAGWELLKQGASSLDAVEAAVVVMEDDPTFDAGKGSFLNRIGEVEMDAVIMDGRNLDAGAVAAIRNVRNPVRVARAVMEKTKHVLMVGEGACLFARAMGFPRCRTQDLLVGRELDRWKALRKNRKFDAREIFDFDKKRGTVGAVAFDREGNLAAATSTGGTPNKLPGRVGDSPLVGAGIYADNRSGAVSATGWGESIIKVVMSKSATDAMAEGLEPSDACARAVGLLKSRVDGLGGLVGIDHRGRPGYAYNTPRMARASFDQKGKKTVGL